MKLVTNMKYFITALQHVLTFTSRNLLSKNGKSPFIALLPRGESGESTCRSSWRLCNNKSIQVRQFSSTTETHNAEEEILVDVTVTNGVRCITFNRPSKKNAVTPSMGRVFISALQKANTDENTSVVVITGNGDYFTSGLDMTRSPRSSSDKEKTNTPEVTAKTEKNPASPNLSKKKSSPASVFIHSLIDCKKPVIVLVNGPAIGFGVTMLGLCDAVYASDKATFQTTFTRLGLPPEFCSTYTFPRIMGYGQANHVLMLCNKITAQEAFNCGLVSRIFPHETFKEQTSKIVQEFGKLPLKSLVYSKELVRGRERQLLKQVSEKEQSFFDPEAARAAKEQFISKKNQA